MLASMGAGKSFILGEFVAHYLQDNIEVDHPTRKGHGVHMLVLCSTVSTMTDTIISDIESSFELLRFEKMGLRFCTIYILELLRSEVRFVVLGFTLVLWKRHLFVILIAGLKCDRELTLVRNQ